jgi:hypothetical protein
MCGDGCGRPRLGRGVAFREFGSVDRAAVDEEGIEPARFASDWHSTTGRLSSVDPWQASGPQDQVMSRATNLSLSGVAGFAE